MNMQDIKEHCGVNEKVAEYLSNVQRSKGDIDEQFQWHREYLGYKCESREELDKASICLKDILS